MQDSDIRYVICTYCFDTSSTVFEEKNGSVTPGRAEYGVDSTPDTCGSEG
jgi:hypothetical protein